MATSSSNLPAEELQISSPTLDTLIPHLLAAKRSLSCVEHVSHANDIVTSTRRALETHTVLIARTLFIRNGSMAQISPLDSVRQHTTGIAQEAGDEFNTVLEKLDIAESKLRKTLDILRSTPVDPNLHPEDGETKHLSDFVDETGVQTLMNNIKESIDTTSQSRRIFEETIEALDQETNKVKELLSSRSAESNGPTTGIELRSPVPEILNSMESQAGDMARNLESLVKHFDLCVTAIKHTEGGGAAASKITRDLPDGMELHLSADDTPLERISNEEMDDMLEVLSRDAEEVEEVVTEVRGAILDMETKAGHVKAFGERLEEELSRTVAAFHLLEDLGNRLPGFITQGQIFAYRWDEEKGKVDEYMNDLENFREFYAKFLYAYDNLLIEVGRRKDVEKRIARIRQDAFAKIERLVQEENTERQAFRQDQGDFLPVDIWPGLTAAPARYEISKVEGAVDSIPDISASVINGAIKRVSTRRKDG